MQNIVIDKPYVFVPPYRGTWWPRLLRMNLQRRLRWNYGVQSVECRGVEKLRASSAAGHGIILAPNHSRYDPMTMNEMCARWGVALL